METYSIGQSRLEGKLGFDRIRQQVAAGCSTVYGKNRAFGEEFSVSPETIGRRLDLTDEMRLIMMFEKSFPSSGYVDSLEFLSLLETDSSYLSKESLVKLRTSEETLRGIVAFFADARENLYPNLRQMVSKVTLHPEIGRRIDAIIDRYGEISDNASPALCSIRRNIRDKEGAISKRIESILRRAQSEGITDADASPSIRDGRCLIPVPAANKKKINGFILDESSSGKTVFIEPVEVVELSNAVKELQFEEQREIVRILVEFSDFIRPYLPELMEAARFMGEMDYIKSKALLALSMSAGKPVMSLSGELILRNARHPLLEANLAKENKKIVPLDLSLDTSRHILLISGPNAGGKSVCLKTVGLLQYMLQCGYLVPASEASEMRVFRKIFIDIGDEQSIDNDLSTYSSHLLNMKEMLRNADSDTLVLIDEFGSGTEPAAGGAIAEAILEEIESRGCFGVITTHYTNLKYYASGSSGVMNGAMLFDVRNIQPLFKLETGLPGSSFAFELARKMGLPENIVRRAEERVGTEFVDVERHLRKIARSKRDIDRKLERIRNTDRTLENITDRYQKELTEIQSMKKQILDEARREAKSILEEANRRIEGTIKQIRESQAEKEKTKTARESLKRFASEVEAGVSDSEDEKIARKIEKLRKRQERREERKRESSVRSDDKVPVLAERQQAVITEGDPVRLSNGMTGEVLSCDGKKASVLVGAIRMTVEVSGLSRISSNDYRKSLKSEKKPVSSEASSAVSRRRLEFKSNIDIRGYRLNDALDAVCSLVDDALMLDVRQVRILHGKGNGILKEEIRKYLSNFPGVVSCRDESVDAGGSGITVVTLE